FHDFNLIVQSKARIGIVGDNGVGKSTLLNLINQELELTEGSLIIGETVRLGYFSQEIRGISKEDEKKRLINFLEEVASASRTSDGQVTSIVDLLEEFLFPRPRHGELISKLSGGEKKRLFLLKILLLSPNVLLLDEPTNDLDVKTLTVLENFLKTFPGAVITVSHDRYFQDKISEELLIFESGEIKQRMMSYSDYLKEKSKQSKDLKEKVEIKVPENSQENEKLKLSYAEKKDWETLETEISQLEEEISILQSEMLTNGENFEKLSQLQKILEEKEVILSEKYQRWEFLSEKLEEIEKARQ
ncbi:MAG: ATP-binding cassette domain-containing protein, partial [Lactovum sp.]